MTMASAIDKKEGIISRGWDWLKALPGKVMVKVVELAKKTKKLGQDDPRRIIHSLKVGLAITLVSLFYFFEPLYSGFGGSAMWAVLTVVVVFEFSVGATLSRGLNRGLATFLAGTLGFGAHRLASLSGEVGGPILHGLFVFLIAVAVTFARFFPRMKARYDYGLLIFILTFCLISVSGYRDEQLLELAHRRISTILIGGLTAVFVCILICPVWAGDDLHNLVANNIEKLASFLEGFGPEYFKILGDGESTKTISQGYKSVLNSKHIEESLANFARWEPGHGRIRFRHPWKQYLKIGSLTRQCAYRIEALNGHLNAETQTPQEIKVKIQEASIKLCSESVKALKELALAIRTMTSPCSANPHVQKSKIFAKSLQSLLNTDLCKETHDLIDVMPVATMASLLVDVVSCAEKIAESIHELASLAKFKSQKPKVTPAQPNLCRQRTMQTSSSMISTVPHHVITIDQPCLTDNGSPSKAAI